MTKTLRFLDWHQTVEVEIREIHEHQQKHWQLGAFYEGNRMSILYWAAHNVPQGSRVVDVGASIGNHSLFFAGMLGCDVIAVEPVSRSVDHMRANLALNGLSDRVEINQCALHSVPGRTSMELYGDQDLYPNAGMYQMTPGDDIPVQTLDDIVAGRQVSFIKIDVEHTEVDVVRGGTQTFTHIRPMVAVECVESLEEVDAILCPLGYELQEGSFNYTPTYLWLPRT